MLWAKELVIVAQRAELHVESMAAIVNVIVVIAVAMLDELVVVELVIALSDYVGFTKCLDLYLVC